MFKRAKVRDEKKKFHIQKMETKKLTEQSEEWSEKKREIFAKTHLTGNKWLNYHSEKS